jgi:hypothetical protein
MYSSRSAVTPFDFAAPGYTLAATGREAVFATAYSQALARALGITAERDEYSPECIRHAPS